MTAPQKWNEHMQTTSRLVAIPPEPVAPVHEQRIDIRGLTPTEAEIIAVALSKNAEVLEAKDRLNGTNWAELADHIKRSLFKRTRGSGTPLYHEALQDSERELDVVWGQATSAKGYAFEAANVHVTVAAPRDELTGMRSVSTQRLADSVTEAVCQYYYGHSNPARRTNVTVKVIGTTNEEG